LIGERRYQGYRSCIPSWNDLTLISSLELIEFTLFTLLYSYLTTEMKTYCRNDSFKYLKRNNTCVLLSCVNARSGQSLADVVCNLYHRQSLSASVQRRSASVMPNAGSLTEERHKKFAAFVLSETSGVDAAA